MIVDEKPCVSTEQPLHADVLQRVHVHQSVQSVLKLGGMHEGGPISNCLNSQ